MGDNDIHVCRDTVMHHMLNYLHGGLVPISKWLYMVAVTGSIYKSIHHSSGSSWSGVFVSQLDRLQCCFHKVEQWYLGLCAWAL